MRCGTIMVVGLALALAGLAGCGEHREARTIYNDGVAALEKRDLEQAEKLLLEARSKAGVDPELRFRAAFDLGVAFAAHSDKVKPEDLAKALDLAGQALSWFGDAARQRPTDEGAKANQQILRARVQALSDELRKAEGKLEARIDAVIGEQRGVLDGARAAWLAIKKAGGADPLAQQPRLASLADAERGIVAEVGAISDLAADEIDAIGKKPEEQRTDQEKVRAVQLRGLDIYLLEARARIAEARRKLQELATEDALGRAEAAMAALKRAREQLLDPITVMRHVARDELELMQDTGGAGGGSGFQLGARTPAPEAVSPWLEPAVLAERQGGLRDRLEEVRTRLAAAVAAPEQKAADPGAKAPEPTPEQAKLLERVKIVLPFVGTAVSAMEAAKRGLADKQLGLALDKEREALEALARAIEEFADLKQTIELAYADQEQISALLSPEAAKLPADERGKQTREALARNTGRAERLQGRIAEAATQLAQEEQQLAAKAAQGGGSGAGGGGGGSGAGSGSASAADAAKAQLDAAKQQLEAEKQKLARAEELRGQYRAALAQLEKGLAAAQDPAAPAADARQKITELRNLFFSVIEHLEQLIRDQGDTRDRTSEAHAADPLAREAKLPELIAREEQHGAMAKAITDALAAQADAAGKQPQQPQQGGPDGKTLSAAADEVRHAQRAMTDAVAGVTKVRDTKTSSESLEPALKSQGTAIEHLENALKLLQPPKQQQQQDQQQDQQQQQQDQQKEQQQQQRGGQSARDQDAQQQKKRRERESSKEPVEKDW